MRIAYYVSKNATRFIKALREKYINKCDTEFVIVDHLETPKLKEICDEYQIRLYQFSYEEMDLNGKKRNEFISAEFLKLLKKHHCDYAFLLGGRLLLQGKLINEYEYRIINFHPSILPSYKAEFNAIDRALKDNVILLGNTAHFINEQPDDGIMIMHSLIAAHNFDNYDTVLDMQLPMLRQIISWMEQGRFVFDSSNGFYIKDAQYEIEQFIPNLEFCEQL